jgi:Fibronectin type III domain
MSRIYDSSQLTMRLAQQTIAGGFMSQFGTAPNNFTWGSRPPCGIKDSSIMNDVLVGSMTQYTRYPTSIGISPGCPCGALITSLQTPPYIPALPGAVSGITYTVGSIIVSWNAPTTGDGPFSYVVTPYLNGVAQTSITTTNTTYRFTDLDEWQPYTFTICAKNAGGQGPEITSPYFLAPPDSLSAILSGSYPSVDITPSLQYIMTMTVDNVLQYIASSNLGPTKGSRMMYLFAASIVQAWNWVRSDTNVTGVHDNWDWTNSKSVTPLSDNDSIVWLTCVADYLTSQIYAIHSIYNCPASTIARVQTGGQWSNWTAAWGAWYANRLNDGSVAAAVNQPTSSANWNNTIVVDGVTVNNISGFPQPQEWTRLTINGVMQKYATYQWDNVTSTCLSEIQESVIQASVAPATGTGRDAEIDNVLNISQHLTDQEKIIAEFWAGSSPGTMPPPLMAVWLWKEYMRSTTITPQTLMYSLLDLAIHLFEGGRVTWRLKGFYMQDRPIQEIRRRYTNQQITSWNGVIDGAQWIPYQPSKFVTPPFPDFPSGHSNFTKLFALTMNKWFGSTITKNQLTYDLEPLYSTCITNNETALYGDFTLQPGTSAVQPGIVPSTPIVLSFSTWDDMADQAGMSRIYGGIHTITAHTASQDAAIQIDQYINASWNISS